MIEQVLNRRNVMKAYRQVLSNKGSAGVDDMSVKELYDYLTKNRKQIETQLREGKYFPQAIRGIEIPKSNGKTRLLVSYLSNSCIFWHNINSNMLEPLRVL
jgi:retron-type reverse transcriptase